MATKEEDKKTQDKGKEPQIELTIHNEDYNVGSIQWPSGWN